MASSLWSISCDPTCGFAVQSHDKNEVINLCYEHASLAHPDQNLTREQLGSMVSADSFCSR
ncbi:MAG: hypothetical protein HY675_26545 [Chloroflexi bacterium]|nr:hypothetical protein [Chloroflexota bacterium]